MLLLVVGGCTISVIGALRGGDEAQALTEKGAFRADDAAIAISKRLDELGIRYELDLRNEKIGFKIREAQMEKVPYMFVLGDKEAENGTVAVRGRKGDLGTMTLDEILARIQ